MVKSKKSDLPKAKINSSKTDFLTSGAKKAFTHLQKAFTKAPILRYFDLECYIWLKTDVSKYAIGRVLRQMTSDQHFSGHVTNEDLNFSKSEIGQWYPVAFFTWKMIFAKTWYKTHNQELLAIIKAFQT